MVGGGIATAKQLNLLFMQENGQKKGSDMVEGCKFGEMGQNMKVTGRMTWQMEGEGLYIQMGVFMKENG